MPSTLNKPNMREYAPSMRRALYEGLLEAAKAKDLTLTEYCQTWWDDDWKAALNAMSKFMPREQQISGKIDHNHNIGQLSQTVAFIEKVINPDTPVGQPQLAHSPSEPVLALIPTNRTITLSPLSGSLSTVSRRQGRRVERKQPRLVPNQPQPIENFRYYGTPKSIP